MSANEEYRHQQLVGMLEKIVWRIGLLQFFVSLIAGYLIANGGGWS